jgi:serine phosphatase RsbU (regulator of sigma subunit)
LLEKQKLEIERQKKIVDEKNKKISDSINYARHIQTSILPLNEEIENSFPSYLLYYKPKDIVSGDFYWHIATENKVFFAIADCTGHGVPGSIMSMIGNILLNEIIHEKKIYEPSHILNTLNNFVKSTLRQNANLTNRVKDGMDIAICAYDKSTNKIQYSGANIPLYVVNKLGEIIIYKPDKAAIGGYTDDKFCFTQTEILIENNEWAYLFSDGFIDQFGGEKNKKYSIKRMKDLFLEMLNLSATEKFKAIENAHVSWQNKNEQTDDILVFGFEMHSKKKQN